MDQSNGGADRPGRHSGFRRRARSAPRGRQLDRDALSEVRELLGDRPRRRDLLIEFLHLIQDGYGHLSARHLRALGEELRIPQAAVYEVATFYAHFDVVKEGETPPPETTIRVCDSISCAIRDADALLRTLEAGLDPAEVRVLRAPCMGRCDAAPVCEVGHRHVDGATFKKVEEVLRSGIRDPSIPTYERLADYRAAGGYAILEACRSGARALEAVIAELSDAGLRGLGERGFLPARNGRSCVRSPAQD